MRSIKTKKDQLPCPNCNNKRLFDVHSAQVCEDGCEVWVSCHVCGYDPTNEKVGHRLESVMGGTDDDNAIGAIMVWNDEIEELTNGNNK